MYLKFPKKRKGERNKIFEKITVFNYKVYNPKNFNKRQHRKLETTKARNIIIMTKILKQPENKRHVTSKGTRNDSKFFLP